MDTNYAEEYVIFFEYLLKKVKEDAEFRKILSKGLVQNVEEVINEYICHIKTNSIDGSNDESILLNNIKSAIVLCLGSGSAILDTWNHLGHLANDDDCMHDIDFERFMRAEAGYQRIREYLGLAYEYSTGYQEADILQSFIMDKWACDKNIKV